MILYESLIGILHINGYSSLPKSLTQPHTPTLTQLKNKF
jgi:hypothetical protein